MTYVAGAPGHVDNKDGETKQQEHNGEDKDHPRTQGEVHLQHKGATHVEQLDTAQLVRGHCCGPKEQFTNGYQDLRHSCCFQTSTKTHFFCNAY